MSEQPVLDLLALQAARDEWRQSSFKSILHTFVCRNINCPSTDNIGL